MGSRRETGQSHQIVSQLREGTWGGSPWPPRHGIRGTHGGVSLQIVGDVGEVEMLDEDHAQRPVEAQ